jgi:hypothetical protein
MQRIRSDLRRLEQMIAERPSVPGPRHIETEAAPAPRAEVEAPVDDVAGEVRRPLHFATGGRLPDEEPASGVPADAEEVAAPAPPVVTTEPVVAHVAPAEAEPVVTDSGPAESVSDPTAPPADMQAQTVSGDADPTSGDAVGGWGGTAHRYALLAAIRRARRTDSQESLETLALELHRDGGQALDFLLEAYEHADHHRSELVQAIDSYGMEAVFGHASLTHFSDEQLVELGAAFGRTPVGSA